MQDIRIVELKNRGWPMQVQGNEQDSFAAFAYFNEILVHPVERQEQDAPLQTAYSKMQEIFRRGYQVSQKPCIAHQTIMAFTDIAAQPTDLTYTPDEVEQFWAASDEVYFFVSMINVSPEAKLKTEVRRIRRLLRRHKGLLYLTYEYNELLLFVKGSSLQKYAKLMMEICFGRRNQGVLDSITVCTFTGVREPEDENVVVSVHLGTTNYQQARRYLRDSGIGSRDLRWLLGRNDIGLTLHRGGLRWIYDLYRDCLKRSELLQWLSTANFSILIPKTYARLNYQPRPLTPLDLDLSSRIDRLCGQYEKKCGYLNIKPDEVFMRMLREVGALVRSSWENRLAGDLAIYMLPELEDFLAYMEILLSSKELTEKHAETLRSRLSVFYLNILSLVSSTVHSNHEFVQIPHCAPPRFEMPSKVMAYYSLIVRKIIRAFQDEENLYGVILAPNLVDELEVQSLAIDEIKRKDQLLSVNIGEALLYNLHSTVATLGHEMAHFVGENTRCRELRRKNILAYHIYGLLDLLLKYGIDLLPDWAREAAEDSIDPNALRTCAEELCATIPVPEDNPRLLLRKLASEVASLDKTIFSPPENRERIFDAVFCPMLRPAACVRALLQRCGRCDDPPTEGQMAYAHARAEYIFSCAVDICRSGWSAPQTVMEFDDYVSYLFSEAYADLAMVTLFRMSLKDYICVFERGIRQLTFRDDCQEDSIELIRFLAVVRTVHSAGGPVKKLPGWAVPREEAPEGDTWGAVLQRIVHLSPSEELADFCKSKAIDITLLTLLVNYLRQCFLRLSENFAQQGAAVEQVRRIYRSIGRSRTTLSQLTEIRQMEQSYLHDRA